MSDFKVVHPLDFGNMNWDPKNVQVAETTQQECIVLEDIDYVYKDGKITIEEAAYSEFKKLYGTGEFKDLRYGQAFFNHFNLHKMSKASTYDRLYNSTDISECVRMIRSLFVFH